MDVVRSLVIAFRSAFALSVWSSICRNIFVRVVWSVGDLTFVLIVFLAAWIRARASLGRFRQAWVRWAFL